MADKLTNKTANLVKGEVVTVKGQLGFTKYLTRLLEGKELEEVCAKREYATETPHFEGTIVNPALIAKTKDANGKPQPTDAERVIAGKVYKKTDAEGNEIKVLSLEKKVSKEGKGSIAFGVKREDGLIHPINLAGKSLLQGQDVTVTFVTREYEYKGKKGLSQFLDAIVFEKEPELYKPQARAGWATDEDAAPAEEAPAETAEEEAMWQ